MRVTNLGSAVLSVYLDSASELPQVRAQSKPDPFAILSVGKSKNTHQTAALRRTDVPVWEQGFTFIVPNPANDTLQVKIVDQKTEKELGHFSYVLSTLLTKNDLQVVSQPFQLQKSGPTSKITMSLALKILTRPSNQPSEPAAGDWAPMQRQSSQSSQSQVQRQSSQLASQVQRQPSQVSQSDISEVKNVNLADFPTKFADITDEVEQDVEKSASALTEFISNEAAGVLNEDTSSPLRKRQLSTQSSSSLHGLGSIQISMHYSVDRQRLSVTVHKIM